MKALFLAILGLIVTAEGGLVARGCGWYLLKPPLLEKGPTEEQVLQESPQWRGADKAHLRDLVAALQLDRNAPLSRWTHEASFDTAAACQEGRKRLIAFEQSQEAELRRDHPEGLPRLGTELALESRCIASEDPRLARR